MRPRPVALRGSVLLLTLWGLFVLSALAVALGLVVLGRLKLVDRVVTEEQSRALARAAVELAVATGTADSNGWDSIDEAWSSGEGLSGELGSRGGHYRVRSLPVSVADGIATGNGLADEERRINLNSAKPALLQAALELIGEVSSSEAESIAAAVVDWRDGDGDETPGGAESSYYSGLSPPYPCRDAPLTSVHELVLVRGITPELVAALAPHVTVHGSGKINVNTAPQPVLMALASSVRGSGEARESAVHKICRYRAAGGRFEQNRPQAMANELGLLSPDELGILNAMAATLTNGATCFRGLAEGTVGEGRSPQTCVAFVFSRLTGRILAWRQGPAGAFPAYAVAAP